jgi:hypothetical protein
MFGISSSASSYTSSSCGGACTYMSGYYCAAGSFSSTGLQCPAGFACSTMSAPPTVCKLGYFCPLGTSDTTQQLCSLGTYGATTGLQSPACSDICTAGYYCPPGSTNGTAAPCSGSAVYCPQAAVAPG